MSVLVLVLAIRAMTGWVSVGWAAALSVPAGGRAGFSRLDSAMTGVGFTNVLSDESAAANQIRLNGSGVALGDVDGDGLPDVFLAGLEGPNRLYRNLGGFRFEEVTLPAEVSLTSSHCTGVVLADVDGDGDLDLLAGAIGEGVRLWLNDGRGGFSEPPDSGLFRKGGVSTLTLADIDGDSDLDLYVANYRTATIRTTGFALLNVNGRREIPPNLKDDLELTPEGKVLEHGEPDVFYVNDGKGRFRPTQWGGGRWLDENGTALSKAPRDWGLCASFRDINQDGYPDLYVANDFHSPDRIWINRGNGQFQALPALAIRQTSTFSMSVEFGDLDRDGWDDFFLSDMLDPNRERRMVQMSAMEPNLSKIGFYRDRPQYDRNTLFRNRGDGTYAEVAHFAGVEAAGWSWSAVFLDVDLDGLEDILLTTGHMFDTQDLDAAARIERMGPVRRDQIARKLLMYPRLQLPKVAFRNLGGLRFAEFSSAWGFHDAGVSHGMALGDLDGDGDLDVVVNNLNAAAGIYRNETSAPRVRVRLHGTGMNTRGIGARVSLEVGGVVQSQEFQAGGRYLSSDDPIRTFAWLGAPDVVGRLVVSWRSGRISRVENVRANEAYEIHEPSDPPPERPEAAVRRPAPAKSEIRFVDVSERLGHRHVEADFDDFVRQPLLPRRLSQPGPGMAWADIDDDGWDDLAIGTGRGGRLGLFRNDRKGGFVPMDWPAVGQVAAADVTGILSDPMNARGWVFATSNYENVGTNGLVLHRIQAQEPAWNVVATHGVPAAETLASADYDGDGDLDLFVGGRCVPGRYPEGAGGRLLRNEAGRWTVDLEASRALEGLGMISGAVWSDLDADGFSELIVATDWGPIVVLRNQRGRLERWNAPVEMGASRGGRTTLQELTGWWTTVAAGDFDGDGRPDLLAGNWGTNTRYRASGEHPIRLRFGDFDESGTLDVLETSFDVRLSKEVPDRDLNALRQAVPSLFARFGTYASYAREGVREILGDAWSKAGLVEARTLVSCVLLNRGDHWVWQPLPDEAQWSPVMDVAVGDFDADGWDDVFLAQNFFAVTPTMSRCDAGMGLILQNRKGAGWVSVSGQACGLRVDGEQRSAAIADFDGDGRADLIVGQNGAETRLFRNNGGRRGLRVRVAGKPGNPRGIGVALQWKEGERRSGVREVRSGSGRLSQDSSTLVLGGIGETGGELEIRWPGGKTSKFRIAPGASEIRVTEP